MKALLLALSVVLSVALALPAVAPARTVVTQVSTRTWTDAAGNHWTETTTTETIDDEPETGRDGEASRFVGTAAPAPKGLARFGPFVVLETGRAALVDATDSRSPARFAAMLRHWPGIRTLDMVDCPGTLDDTANLLLGRMIRARGLATRVPPGGSVRSGAVDLFLAGVRREAAADADFGVHAWEDDRGRGPGDYAPDAPVNRAYLRYYRAMGMAPERARAFYDLTNSVPNAQVRWLHAADIARFIAVE